MLAVAELGSFRGAAAALGFTQSALSHQVSALEAALGVRVGVTQTAAAEIMPAALRVFRDDHPGVEVVLVAPKIVYRTDDNLALQRLVAAGLGHACIGRVAASRAVDPALTWLEPDEATAQRTIALCYARHRPVTATARTLITAIRSQAG